MDAARNRWQEFWATGRWWKAVLAVLAYLALYELAGFGLGKASGDLVEDDIFATPASVFFGLAAPLVVGAVLLVVFITTTGMARPIFARQPVRARPWMWVVVVLAVAPVVLRFLGIDYDIYARGVVPMTLFAGLFIGFTEELLYRGVVVNLLRSAGHRERVVAVVSSALFALSHSVNIFSGQSVGLVALTVIITFGFGIVMYVVMRATGSIIWPMLIHAMDDPSTFLATGGIDETTTSMNSVLLDIAAPFNIIFVVVALVAIVFIRGRATDEPSTALPR